MTGVIYKQMVGTRVCNRGISAPYTYLSIGFIFSIWLLESSEIQCTLPDGDPVLIPHLETREQSERHPSEVRWQPVPVKGDCHAWEPTHAHWPRLFLLSLYLSSLYGSPFSAKNKSKPILWLWPQPLQFLNLQLLQYQVYVSLTWEFSSDSGHYSFPSVIALVLPANSALNFMLLRCRTGGLH